MESKYSDKTQDEINLVLKELDPWKTLFSFEVSYYFEGWAVTLKEKNLYPRLIVIFKSYKKDCYSVKSFEIHYDENKNESYKELYLNEEIKDKPDLISEIKEIIYGKDLIKSIAKDYYDNVS